MKANILFGLLVEDFNVSVKLWGLMGVKLWGFSKVLVGAHQVSKTYKKAEERKRKGGTIFQHKEDKDYDNSLM